MINARRVCDRVESIDSDAEFSCLAGQTAGEPENARLRGPVYDLIWGPERRARRDVDDPSVALLFHERQYSPAHPDVSEQVHLHDLGEIARRNLFETRRVEDTRVV